jgi:hypothetical protein
MPAFFPYAVVVLAAAWLGLIFLPSLLNRTRGGGARLRRPATERTLRNISTASQLVLWRGLHIPHDLSVDGARDAVLELQVHLGDGVLGEDGGIGDITCTGQSSNPHGAGARCAPAVKVVVGDVRMAADSTMLRMVNLFIALSLGVHREQLEQRMGLTWPRPFLLRPLSCVSIAYAASFVVSVVHTWTLAS